MSTSKSGKTAVQLTPLLDLVGSISIDGNRVQNAKGTRGSDTIDMNTVIQFRTDKY